LKVFANYTPATGDGKKLLETDIVSKLNSVGINRGIKSESIKYLCESTKPLLNIPIAEAVPPETGENARIETYFSLNTRKKALEKENGNVDFHDLGEISSTKEGQPLYKRIPPTIGNPGFNVYGDEIPGLPGKDFKIVLGQGTLIDEHDPNLVRAANDGEIVIINGIVQVSKTHIVEGDVDFSSGNINFNGSIKIKGDVKGGFKVEAMGDIEILGIVEDATVIGGNDVIIRGGFAGNGDGLISAKRDVFVKFVENQKIEAERDIIIESQSYHAKLFAGRSVIAKTGNSAIIGGITEAKYSVETGKLGSEASPPTLIKVGIDPKLMEKLKNIEDELFHLNDSAEKIEKSIIFLYRMKIDNHGVLPPHKMELLKKMEETRDAIPLKQKELENSQENLLKEQEDVEKAYVSADNFVFPKVTIYIGNQWISIDEKLGPSTYRIFKSEIVRSSS